MNRRARNGATQDGAGSAAGTSASAQAPVPVPVPTAAVRESEAQLRALFAALDQGFCILEMLFDAADRPVDYRFLETNLAFTQQSGLTDVVGRTALELVPTLEAHWFELYGRVATTGEATRFESGSDAMGRWFDVFAIRVGAPEARRVALIFSDVSAAKAAERERERLVAELRSEREGLRSLILHMPAPVALMVGPEHRFAIVNDAFRRVSGRGRDVTGLTPLEASPALEGSELFARFDSVYESGERWTGRETLVRYDRDGTGVTDNWFDLHFEPVRDADGRVTAILNFAMDVTEQVRTRRVIERHLLESEAAWADADRARADAVRAAAALAESETRYRELFAALDEGFCVIELLLDDDGRACDYRYLEANPAFVLQSGFTDAVGRRVRELVPDIEPHWFEIFGHVAVTGEPTRFQGESAVMGRWFNLFAFRVGRPGDRRVAVLFTDITRAKAAEGERERLLADSEHARGEAEAARVEAEAANRVKGEFLAVMSHELRTPLNAIGGYAELMEMGIRGPVTAQQSHDLARIQQSQRHLLGLINEVLNYAKLETGTVRYDIADVLVRDALAVAEGLVAPQARAKGLTLTVAGAECEVLVRADPDKLRQILVNLLSNAVKFTERGGSIDVTGRTADGKAFITIRDSGIGIPADQLERIFEPFVQVRADLTRPHEGTGLGLAISRDLARAMDGELLAESAPGAGSAFTLVLPVTPQPVEKPGD